VTSEVHHRYQHENDQYEFDGSGIEMTDAGVVGRKAAEGDHRKGMTDGIEPIHADRFQCERGDNRQTSIGEPQRLGRFRDSGSELFVFHRTRCFGAIQGHATDAE